MLSTSENPSSEEALPGKAGLGQAWPHMGVLGLVSPDICQPNGSASLWLFLSFL